MKIAGITSDAPVDINDTLLGACNPAKLTPTYLDLPEPFPVCVAFVQYFYTLSLSTPLQNRAPVLSALLFLAKQYKIGRLAELVVHALHERLDSSNAIGVYEIATLSGQQNLQVRALNVIHVSHLSPIGMVAVAQADDSLPKMVNHYEITDKLRHPMVPVTTRTIVHRFHPHHKDSLRLAIPTSRHLLLPESMVHSLPTLHIKLVPNRQLWVWTMRKMPLLCLLPSISREHHLDLLDLLLHLLYLPWRDYHYPLHLHRLIRVYLTWATTSPTPLYQGGDLSLPRKLLHISPPPARHSVDLHNENHHSYLEDRTLPSILGEVLALNMVEGWRLFPRMEVLGVPGMVFLGNRIQ